MSAAEPESAAMGEEADDDEFENATVEAIEVGRDPVDAISAAEAARAAMAKAKLDRMHGDTRRMGQLFWFVVGLVSAVVVGVYGVFIAYIVSEWGEIPSQAIIALIAGTVVEVIAILAVITRYLYRIEKDEADRYGK